MANLEYSPTLGGFVPFGTVATATAIITPTTADALFVRQRTTLTLGTNLAAASLTIGGLAGQAPVVTLPEGALFAANVTVLNGGSLALGANRTSPNPNNPARLGADLTVAAGGNVTIVDGRIAGTLTPTGHVDIRNNATLTDTAHLAFASLANPLGLTSQATGTLTIAGALDTPSLLAVLGNHDSGFNPLFNGTLVFTGALDNTSASLPLDSLTGLRLGAATILGGTLTGGTALAGVTLNGVDIGGTMTAPAGATDTITGTIGGFGTIAVDGTLALTGQIILDATTLVVGSQGTLLGSGGINLAIGTFSAIDLTGPAAIDFSAGSTVTLDGTVDTGDNLTNTVIDWTSPTGSLTINGGGLIRIGTSTTLNINTAVVSTGTILLAGGTLDLLQSASLGEVDFGAAGATLMLGARGDTAGLVNFADGDTIVVAGAADFGATPTLNNGTLDITGSDGLSDGHFLLSRSDGGVYAPGDFNIGIQGNDLTLFTSGVAVTACYAAGTRIALEDGDCPIEAITPGRRVRTRNGTLRQVIWTGRRRVDLARHPRPHDANPVRIRAHAFGPGLPLRDLLLSPDHAIYAGGVLIPARYLLNGATVTQEAWPEITYHHLELASHDVILAEGLPCETYLDTGNRGAFEGAAAPRTLHPEFSRQTWAAGGCAPLHTAGPLVLAMRQTLQAHAEALDYRLTTQPCLRLTPSPTGIWLTSRSFVPAEVRPESADRRRLGVAIASLMADGQPIPLDDRRLTTGWHPPEPGWRWTTGEAELAVPPGSRITVTLADAGALYWEAPARVAIAPLPNRDAA